MPPKMENKHDLFNRLTEIITCPICYEKLSPDVVCCNNGHAICKACKRDLLKCPTCEGEFFTGKLTCLTQVLEVLSLCCKYEDCFVVTDEMSEHEKWCTFRPQKCKNCTWKGPAKDLLAHVKPGSCPNPNSQPTEVVSTKATKLNVFKFLSDSTYYRSCLFSDVLIWRYVNNSTADKKLTLKFIGIPLREVKEKYFMKVQFISEETEYISKFQLDLNCEEEHTLYVDSKMLHHFMSPGGDLGYQINLFKI